MRIVAESHELFLWSHDEGTFEGCPVIINDGLIDGFKVD